MRVGIRYSRVAVLALGLTAGGNIIENQAVAQTSPTFEQVLQAPDDLELNLAYAQAEVRAGNLLAAAAALERILLAHPGAHYVRLYYASVLYRLDDQQGARAQLRMLNNVSFPTLQTNEREKFARLSTSTEKKTKISGTLAAGMGYESDALGLLLTQFDFFTTPVRKPGSYAIVSGRLDATTELNLNLDLYGSVVGTSRSRSEGSGGDLQSGELRAGLAGSSLHSTWNAGAVVRHYLLYNIPYLTEIGAQGEWSWKPQTRWTFSARLEAVDQNYHEQIIDLLESFDAIDGTHDGWRTNLGFGLDYRFAPGTSAGASIGVEWTTSGYEPFAYTAPYIQGNFHTLMGRGIYLDVAGQVRLVDYNEPDVYFLGGIQRESVNSTLNLSLGIPFAAFSEGGVTGDWRENVALVTGLNYANRTERYPLANFESLGGSVKLVWRFGDGT